MAKRIQIAIPEGQEDRIRAAFLKRWPGDEDSPGLGPVKDRIKKFIRDTVRDYERDQAVLAMEDIDDIDIK